MAASSVQSNESRHTSNRWSGQDDTCPGPDRAWKKPQHRPCRQSPLTGQPSIASSSRQGDQANQATSSTSGKEPGRSLGALVGISHDVTALPCSADAWPRLRTMRKTCTDRSKPRQPLPMRIQMMGCRTEGYGRQTLSTRAPSTSPCNQQQATNHWTPCSQSESA